MITINRNNYEEFFILYIDNELDIAAKKMVEDFAAQHPDLKEELDLLLASKLIPDHTLSFEGKENLYKTATSDLNLQESLLLYLDNELPAAEQAALAAQLEQNPAAQQEWNILLQTRLEPETITCPDKESLYRKEEKAAATIIRFRWWRVAAAAVVLLIGGYFTYNILSGNAGDGTEPTVAKGGDTKTVQPVTPAQKDAGNTKDDQAPRVIPANPALQAADAIALVKDENKQPATLQHNPVVRDNTNPQPENKNPERAIAAVNISDNGNNSLKPLNSTVETVASNTHTQPSLQNIKKSGVTIQSPAPLNNETAQRIANNKEIPDEEYAVAEPERKNKLRGFFRKTTRMFEKTTNISATDGDDRLLIGGLAVRLK